MQAAKEGHRHERLLAARGHHLPAQASLDDLRAVRRLQLQGAAAYAQNAPNLAAILKPQPAIGGHCGQGGADAAARLVAALAPGEVERRAGQPVAASDIATKHPRKHLAIEAQSILAALEPGFVKPAPERPGHRRGRLGVGGKGRGLAGAASLGIGGRFGLGPDHARQREVAADEEGAQLLLVTLARHASTHLR